MRVVAIVLLFLAIPTSADDSEEARRLYGLSLDLMVEGQARVMSIADRLRIAGAELCGRKISPVIGIYAPDHRSIRDLFREKDFIKPFVEAAEARFQLGAQPRVLAVVPGLPAAEAGLQPSDLVTAVDGEKVRKRVYLDLLRKRGDDGVVRLEIERDGERQSLELDARMGCTIASRFMFGTAINAYAMSFGSITGIYFYAGILRFLPDDDQLAVIVGHELAHLVLGHTNQPRASERNEAEADYLGLYFAARAGYDVSGAPEVWDSFARNNPYSSIDWGFYRHPISAKRSLELRAVLDEIARKRELERPLEPEEGFVSLVRPEVSDAELEAHQEALREDALKVLRSDQERIGNIGYRLAVAGAPLCDESVAPVLGATVGRARDFAFGKGEEVKAAFGVGDGVTVFAMAPESPAERAGLLVGDRILEIDGDRIKRTKHVFEKLRDSRSGDLAFRIGRGDETIELVLPRTDGCWHGAIVTAAGGTDTASHDNKKEILIPTGLLRFVEDDDELAIAISHQLGHQVIGRFRSAKHEPRADELGLRIAALAGFDVSKAPSFWDRWAAEQFWKISRDMDDTYIPHGAMSARAPAIRGFLAAKGGKGTNRAGNAGRENGGGGGS